MDSELEEVLRLLPDRLRGDIQGTPDCWQTLHQFLQRAKSLGKSLGRDYKALFVELCTEAYKDSY